MDMIMYKTIGNNLRKFRRKQCFLYQAKQCVLGKNICLFCSDYGPKIPGIDSVKDFLSLTNNRRTGRRALFFSIAAIIISIISLFKEPLISYLKIDYLGN